MEITTNNVPRPLLDFEELPDDWKAEFDYIIGGEGSPGFVKYKGAYYDVGEFQSTSTLPLLGYEVFKGWDGYFNTTFFSGLLVRFCDDDCEYVVIGQYMC